MGMACMRPGRQAGRQADSSQAAGRQAKLRANKVRQAGRPKEAQGVTREGGEQGLNLLGKLYYIISCHIISYYIISFHILLYHFIS